MEAGKLEIEDDDLVTCLLKVVTDVGAEKPLPPVTMYFIG